MIKNLKGLFTLAIAMIGFSVAASAQATDVQQATATVGANIIVPISILKNSDLNFGYIVAGRAAGTVVLSTASGKTSATLQFPTSSAAASAVVSAAAFTVSGQANYTYALSYPATYTLSNGATDAGNNTMTLTAINDDATKTLTLGTELFHIGATLNLLANQAAGSYVGTTDFIVNVNYN